MFENKTNFYYQDEAPGEAVFPGEGIGEAINGPITREQMCVILKKFYDTF